MKYFIFLFILIISISGFGQKKIFNKEFSIPEKTPLLLSYYGNLGIHPGLKAGLEYSLFLKEKTKDKKKKTKTIRKTLIVSPSIAFYSDRNSHQGLLISGDLIWRRYTKRMFLSDVSIGLGYFTKFNSGITYEVTPSGVQEISGSRSYFSPSLAYSFGKRFMVKETTPTEVFTRFSSQFLVGQNSSTGIELSVEVGIRMSLKFGFKQGNLLNKIK